MKNAKKIVEQSVDILQEVQMGRPKKQPKVELVSYSMKMVIPTGQYANIQPEIIVKAGTVEIAHDFIAPHMNKLWKEYFMINERRVQQAVSNTIETVLPPQKVVETKSPVASVAFEKATQAIKSCLSSKALELIKSQVEKSVKLTENDKVELMKLSVAKATELREKNL